jgi:hypothetical protein
MNGPACNLLAERSRALVHRASLLMGVLTHPTLADDASTRTPLAAHAAVAVSDLIAALAAAPELSAHLRILQRFDAALSAWQRSVADASPLAQRYQTALLQLAAQVLTSCLHVERLAASESTRGQVTRNDLLPRANPPRS